MRVAINRNSTGFALNAKQIQYYLMKKGYSNIKFGHEMWYSDCKEKWVWRSFEELPDCIKELTCMDYPEEKMQFGYERVIYDGGEYLDDDMRNCRSDPILIEAIEAFPSCNNRVKNMSIIDIPDGVDFIICEHDCGKEWVAEKHRTWC